MTTRHRKPAPCFNCTSAEARHAYACADPAGVRAAIICPTCRMFRTAIAATQAMAVEAAGSAWRELATKARASVLDACRIAGKSRAPEPMAPHWQHITGAETP